MTKKTRLDKGELEEILQKHQDWLNGEPDGERADLSYTDLSYANLSESDLAYANLFNINLSDADLEARLQSLYDLNVIDEEGNIVPVD